MKNFFDPNEYAEVLIPMYGTIHLITFGILLSFIPLLIWQKDWIKNRVANRKFMITLIWFFLATEALYWILMWYFRYEPYYDRFPFNLCGTLSLILPILVLANRFDGVRYFTFWAVGAGFISFINPGFIHDKPLSFVFFSYLVRHYFLFVFPIFVFIGKGYSFKYSMFLKSMAGLIGYSFLIFIANWILGTNYLHLGKNNPLPVPFLPDQLTIWPWTYPSFVVVGILLFHIIFLVFYLSRSGFRIPQFE